ncbi:MAG: biotin--[acetyl-CoA-carboxylase] ligase [Oscillospiraceae bacterium]
MSFKNEIVEILEKNRGNAVSGQELADNLGVTRSAIWKAIRSLRAEGYEIVAVTNRGYTLASTTDIVSEQGIRMFLPKKLAALEVIALKEIDSTNALAKREISAHGAHDMLIVANKQTNGRGRRGNSFYSPSDSGIYMSVVCCPRIKLADSLLITVAAAVAVCESIEALTVQKPQIKWVNDIFINGKKVCGILTEGVSDFETGMVEAIVVGIGINFKTREFPSEIENIAVSLNPCEITRNRMIAEVTGRLSSLTEQLSNPHLIEEYKRRSFIIGRKIEYTRKGERLSATAIDINEDANLVVRFDDGGVEVLKAGEISIGSGSLVGDR